MSEIERAFWEGFLLSVIWHQQAAHCATHLEPEAMQ